MSLEQDDRSPASRHSGTITVWRGTQNLGFIGITDRDLRFVPVGFVSARWYFLGQTLGTIAVGKCLLSNTESKEQ